MAFEDIKNPHWTATADSLMATGPFPGDSLSNRDSYPWLENDLSHHSAGLVGRALTAGDPILAAQSALAIDARSGQVVSVRGVDVVVGQELAEAGVVAPPSDVCNDMLAKP